MTTSSTAASHASQNEKERALPSPSTFIDVQAFIARRCSLLIQHPFLRRLEGEGTFEQAQQIARGITFFIMAFQDVTRLVRKTIQHAELASLAQANEQGDRGHDAWFLQDLRRLKVQVDIRWVFSDEHEVTRDITYSQIADVLRAQHDSSRFAIGLALEAMSEEFFSRMVGFLERMGHGDGLTFFGRHHQQVERSHEIFQSEGQERLRNVVIPEGALTEIQTVIERTFVGVERMAANLEAVLVRTKSVR